MEPTIEAHQHPLFGKWQGDITEPDYGTLDVNIEITALSPTLHAGTTSIMSLDISMCDEASFDCSGVTCSGTWTFDGKSEAVYRFSEVFPEGGDCLNGRVEISMVNDDRLSYAWITDVSFQFSASGILSRK